MSQSLSTAPTAQRQKSILVVDDEPLARTLLRLILVREGFKLDEAEDGYDALEKLSLLNPDLVILDVMMPGMDGFEVCERLKKDMKTAAIPIIMLSARNDPSAIKRSQQVGAKEFLTKPISPRDLVAHVKEIIG